MAIERNKCSECGFHLPKCMCVREVEHYIDRDYTFTNECAFPESYPMSQESFWATAYDKFDRWKRAQWLFYTMISR